MATLSLQRGSSNNLSTLAKKDGQLIVTTDTKKIYLDNGTTRLPLSNSSYCHYSTTSDSSGMAGKYYKINITSTTSWMLAFTVRLYHSYRFYDIEISGYNYGTSHWYAPNATLSSCSTTEPIEVTFGYDADWELWICIPATAYTGLDIFNVTNGFTQIDLYNAFSVTLVDAIPNTIQSSQLIYRPWNRGENVTAASLATARTFQIADNDGTNKGPTVSFNGTSNIIINLPSTIKASTIKASEFIVYNGTSSASLKPNDISNYGNLYLTGSQRNGYYGIHLGDTTNYMTIMSGDIHQGLYNPANSNWIIYYNRENGRIGLGTSSVEGYTVTVNGSLKATNLYGTLTGNASTATKATQDGSGNVITSTYLKLSGGTMTGALNFKNSTLNLMGDDAYIGDQDQAGCICIKGANGTTGLCFIQQSTSAKGFIRWDGSNFQLSNTLNFSNMTGEWSANPTWSNAFINFGSRTHSQVTGTYYTPWLGGVDYVESHGYGATVTLGIYHNNSPSNGGLYIGMSWDGLINDTFYTFRRDGVFTAPSVYGAVWNDYAEYRAQIEEVKPGYIVYSEDDGKLRITKERLQKFEGVVSDTFGFAIGETDDCKTPIAVSGRVLVYTNPEEEFHAGDSVCAGPDGLAYRMTREEIMMYPDRIVGVVSEIPTYETWGTGNVTVNGRIWIKVK